VSCPTCHFYPMEGFAPQWAWCPRCGTLKNAAAPLLYSTEHAQERLGIPAKVPVTPEQARKELFP
jgi:hypothetical protein